MISNDVIRSSNRPDPRPGDAGLTLLELIFVIVVVGIGSVALIPQIAQIAQFSQLPVQKTQAYFLATEKIEELSFVAQSGPGGYDAFIESNPRFADETALFGFTNFDRIIDFNPAPANCPKEATCRGATVIVRGNREHHPDQPIFYISEEIRVEQ
ncbi:MAG: prepilin-type N-terminal cleavage/methylation domain-containing protein [Magnetococcales bacterium]|nr:prepilin-type N-terminal cleavage/methylation domain-containing protein [Magnetococcales bacterium]